MNEQQAWYQGWAIVIEKGGPGSGWHRPPKGTHTAGAKAGAKKKGIRSGFASLDKIGHMPGQKILKRMPKSVLVRTHKGFGSYFDTLYTQYEDGIYFETVGRHVAG